MHTLHLFGTVGTEVTADAVRLQLEQIGPQPLTVIINSQGGSVFEGVAIYEMLRAHPAPVTVEITGWALSIASVIAMAAKRILLAPSGLVMVHNPWSTTSGNAAELRRMADTLDVVRGTLVKAYQRTGKSDAVILKWLDAETWFDADQAREAGLIDGVINEETELPAGANACAFRIPDHLKARILNMQTTTTTTTPSATDEAIQAAIRAENLRQSSIRAAFTPYMSDGDTREVLGAVLADKSCDVVQAKARLLAKMAEGAEPVGGGQYFDVSNWNNEPTGFGSSYSGSRVDKMADFKAAASDVLLARAGVAVQNPHPASRDVERLSVVAMAERVLSMTGVSTSRKSQTEIIRAALSTVDFPELLANTTNRALRAGYENAPATHAAWTAEREVPDFKPQTMVALSEAPSLDRVEELGEYKHGSFSEAAESFRVETFGKIVKISRQALINDDLGAFTRIPQAYGASARRLEADSVYAKLTGDTRLRDKLPLFDLKHGNLAAVDSGLSADSLGAARAAMRRQKGLQGLGYFDPQPRFLLVPVVMETKAEQLLASLVDPAMANNTGNPEWIRRLVLVSDPRLDEVSETAWYLAADPNQHDTIVRAYLAGEPRPYLEENSEFERDAIGHKCRLDFGVGVIDYRGLYKNAGK
jgi:ATP-dependent protease ClpP protease subunit